MVVVLLILSGLAFYAFMLVLMVGLCRDSARGDATLAAYGCSGRALS